MSCVAAIEFINNKLLHIDAQQWFDHLQDVVDNMTEDEKEASRKSRTKQFFLKGRFYKYIYDIASEFYINLQKHKNFVPKLPKNKSETVKSFSEYVLLSCTEFAIVYANDHPEGAAFLELCASSKINVRSNFIYILYKQDLLSHFYHFWVSNEHENMKPTPDHKLRLWESFNPIRFESTYLI